ncbi:porin family protein [Roseateles aquatilis]|nr:porin family protein [Roseateles aquatilis]
MKQWLLIAAAIVGAGAAHAAPSVPDEGMYATVSFARASGSNETYRTRGTPSFGSSVGYRFNSTVGVEVYYRTLSFELFPGWSSQNYSYPETHVGLAATANLPLSGSWSATGRLGVGNTRMKVAGSGFRDDGRNKTTVSAGAGLAWHLSRSVSLTGGYERYAGINTGLWSVGAEFRF